MSDDMMLIFANLLSVITMYEDGRYNAERTCLRLIQVKRKYDKLVLEAMQNQEKEIREYFE